MYHLSFFFTIPKSSNNLQLNHHHLHNLQLNHHHLSSSSTYAIKSSNNLHQPPLFESTNNPQPTVRIYSFRICFLSFKQLTVRINKSHNPPFEIKIKIVDLENEIDGSDPSKKPINDLEFKIIRRLRSIKTHLHRRQWSRL